jgi:serine/threonine-protein kinase RsbW
VCHPQRIFLQIGSDLNALSQVLEWFEHLDHDAVAQMTWMQCQLMLAEGFTNAVRHAHHDRPSTTLIDLEVSILADRIEIRIWDQGAPFDLDRQLKSLLEAPTDDRLQEQGRGLKLMYRVTDFLVYTRTPDDRNLLLLIKHIR